VVVCAVTHCGDDACASFFRLLALVAAVVECWRSVDEGFQRGDRAGACWPQQQVRDTHHKVPTRYAPPLRPQNVAGPASALLPLQLRKFATEQYAQNGLHLHPVTTPQKLEKLPNGRLKFTGLERTGAQVRGAWHARCGWQGCSCRRALLLSLLPGFPVNPAKPHCGTVCPCSSTTVV
jgi:hypothetical protein